MKAARICSTAVLAGIVTVASLLALPPKSSPQDDAAALRAAIFEPVAGTASAGLPIGAEPMISACAAGTPFCTCAALHCSQLCHPPKVGTVTNCSPTQGTYTCTCGFSQVE